MLDKYRNVSSFAPNVTGVTGLETIELIKSVITTFHPDFVIAIDALASSKIENILKSNPDYRYRDSSWLWGRKQSRRIIEQHVGNSCHCRRCPYCHRWSHYRLRYHPLFVPKKISYTKKEFQERKTLFFFNSHHKYQDELSEDEKSQLLGSVGTLTEGDLKQLLKEVLVDENLIVSPKRNRFRY